jgi:predicted transcriptional regulator
LSVESTTPTASNTFKALASEPRLAILNLLSGQLANVSEIAAALDMPLSTTNLHLKVLEEAGLITTELKPAARGVQKVCARTYNAITLQFPLEEKPSDEVIEISMPVGAFVDCEVTPTCGMASATGIIGLLDTPASFYEPDRVQAQLLWFHYGYVEYRFPNKLPTTAVPHSLSLSMELCSEAPLHHPDWESDITLWINGIEVGTWTCPADFGGERGALTPEWWETFNTQYGLHKIWQINSEGSFVDGVQLSSVHLSDLNLQQANYVTVRIGVKPDSTHVGGLNLFGEQFGNYPQAIVMTLRY